MLEGYGEGACLVCAESMWLNFLVCSQSKDLTKSLCRQNDNMPNMPSFTQKMSNTLYGVKARCQRRNPHLKQLQ